MVHAGGEGDREVKARRLFLDEARRRVLSLLCDLRRFGEEYSCWPPPWMFEGLAVLADRVTADDVEDTSALEDAIAAVELELRDGLIDLAGELADVPIPYLLTEPPPAAEGLRDLRVLRGGLG